MPIKFTDNTNKIIEALEAAAEQVVVETTEAIAEKAKANVPVQYGALQSSIYATNGQGSGYAEAIREALQKNPRVAGMVQPEPTRKQKPGVHRGVVSAPLEYGPYIENGVRNRPPQPFLEPAFIEEASQFEMRLKESLKKARRNLVPPQ